jgi:hypothetical protein
LEGIRVSTGKDGGLFLLRKSLHDPVMCLQVEATSKKASKKLITEPKVAKILDLSSLEQYGKIFLSKIMICILRTRITFINTAISSECV